MRAGDDCLQTAIMVRLGFSCNRYIEVKQLLTWNIDGDFCAPSFPDVSCEGAYQNNKNKK